MLREIVYGVAPSCSSTLFFTALYQLFTDVCVIISLNASSPSNALSAPYTAYKKTGMHFQNFKIIKLAAILKDWDRALLVCISHN